MDTPLPAVCLHCEMEPAVHPPGLCEGCAAMEKVRVLYERRKGWTSEWEAHLIELTRRAKRQEPLFP